MEDARTRARENATEIASLLVTGIWLFALLAGWSWWLPFLLFGYIVVVPIVALLFGDEDDRREWWDDWAGGWGWTSEEPEIESTGEGGTVGREYGTGDRNRSRDTRDALETLRDRYAAGELTDEQFERKLERLLETETLEDADEWVRGREWERERDRGPDRERPADPRRGRPAGPESDREPEYER
ncbi:SHOCT domain-containing protein [Natrialbaceae archaeon GCM10025810]|uniref:SHOCT domain-containing protein n=1 Tax=Halovalidus salilacus TaxID=3075124 RepID=UPI003620A85F